MTIKEFACLCGCNPQTLRYYDHVNLLKPVKVDKWSGYRFYEEEQALAFVKIKSLQKAGFTIDEIKGEEVSEEKEYLNLLNNPDYEVVYEKHGWDNVKDFLDEFNDIEDKVEYALYFRVNEVKEAYTMAFANTLLGILIARNTDKKSNFTCNIEKSEDDKNHCWLLKCKG